MKRSYKNLISNSIIFTIANLGTKFVSIVMVPLYTYVMSAEQYGTVDLITTISGILLPIVFMSMSDAVLRYSMDTRYEKKSVLTAGLFIYLCGGLILVPILCIFSILDLPFSEYVVLCASLLICNGLMQLINQFLRASNHVRAFALNGVLYTFAFAGLNIVFLVKLKLGVLGYVYSILCADLVCIVFGVVISRIWHYISIHLDRTTLKQMLNYSIPLIPNALMWWIMDASDKFIITMFLGIDANGLYAISKKLPTLIDTFHGIFNQAWQLSAIQENDSADVKDFSSFVYRVYYVFLFLVVSILLAVGKPVVHFVLGDEYLETWKYIPFLLIAVAFSSMAGFLSSKLIADEKTKVIFRTTVVGAVVNTVLNFILIPCAGINGAAIATMIGFGAVLVIRERILKKNKKIVVTHNRASIIVIVFLQIAVYYVAPVWSALILNLVLFFFLVYCTRDTTTVLLKPILRRIIRRGT